jgi:hypothetical protein
MTTMAISKELLDELLRGVEPALANFNVCPL